MGADLSRALFDARNDHSGVVLQQGRLLLDSDWNELVAILDRRIRAGIADLDSPGPVPGIAGVAVVPRTTPEGFRVTLAGGALTIGRGRMYVDGLLAENHGGAPAGFDPLLAELRGSADTSYLQQPYWPTPEPLPSSGSHLAYLDVWEREVTCVEDPDLIDPAIGVDTTARTQTAWQVRLHPLSGAGATCATPDADLPGWEAVIAPSGARLTVGTIPVDATDDPCALPPSGGYRGLENQTYRVEVHEGGAPGAATFKWSRDNGSVVSPVLEVLSGGTGVRPASLGRDAVLGFADGDWVEFTDDHRELDGRPGEMRLIEVHEGDGTVTFTPALPSDLVMTIAQADERHLRMRRWDQRGQVKSGAGGNLDNLDAPGSAGTITVPAAASTSVVLEHGVVVSFSSTGADFRMGDHWIFAARTADASVEELTAAPPIGLHHHYARLGVLTFPDGETDCRTPWPPVCECDDGGCGDCSVCVTPESHASGALTIQAAVDQVIADGGGTVCLAAGAYFLNEGGVAIDGATSVRVKGQGILTVLIARARGVRVRRSAFVTLQDFTVVSTGLEDAIGLQGTAAATVQSVTVLGLGQADVARSGVGLGGASLLTAIRDCVIVAPVGIGGGSADAALLTAELDVRDNVLVCRDRGIDLSGRVAHVLSNTVTRNTVLRAGEAGLRLRGAIAPGHGLSLTENSTLVGGVGIEVSSSGCIVADNIVTGSPQSVESRSDGIAVLAATLGSLRGPTRITGNRVQDVGGRAVGVLAPVTTLLVTGNEVRGALQGIVMEERARAMSVHVTGNVVSDIGSREIDKADTLTAIQVVGAQRATVESNTVDGVGTDRPGKGECTGIEVLACIESRVAGNSVNRIGSAEAGGRDLGIGVRGRLARTQVSGNAVRRQPVDIDDDAGSGFIGLLIGTVSDPEKAEVVTVKGYSVGLAEVAFTIGASAAFWSNPGPASVTVDANIVSGSGELPTAIVGVRGEVIATGNHFHARLGMSTPALRLMALVAGVHSNRFRGGEPSATLDVPDSRVAVLGNLCSNLILLNGAPLPAPWAVLNPAGV